METAQHDGSSDVDLDVVIDNAVTYRRIMQEARGQYEQAAADYRLMVSIALDEGVPVQQLADALGVTRDAVYKAARAAS